MWTDTLDRPVHGSWTRTTDATVEPLDVGQAHEWLRDVSESEAATVAALIKSARMKVEDDTGLALYTQTWTYALDRIPATRQIVLPVWPVQSVTSVKYYSTADVESTAATSVYRVDTSSLPARIVLKENQSWPTDVRPQDAFSIVFVAGWATVAAIPEPLRLAMRLLVDHWFHNRGLMGQPGQVGSEIAMAYSALIAPHTVRVLL